MSYTTHTILEDGYHIHCLLEEKNIPLDPANSDYQRVLDDIIEQGASCFTGDIPTDLQTAADTKLFNQQLESYTTAIARLAQYVIADGRTEVVESLPTGEQVWNEETEQLDDLIADVITVTAIDPVDATIEQTTNDEDGLSITTTIENPLITQDNAERAEAQAVVDTTPQAVIDTYNGE